MSKKKPCLREADKDFLFGWPEELSHNKLPSYGEVMRHFLWEKKCRKDATGENPPLCELALETARKTIHIWKKASIPTVSEQRVASKILQYNKSSMSLRKSGKRESATAREKVTRFREASEKLFDICSCKCSDPDNLCNCKKVNKVPKEELPFLQDQRKHRKMIIGGVDSKTTAKIKRNVAREEKRSSENKTTTKGPTMKKRKTGSGIIEELSSTTEISGTSETDSDFEPVASTSKMTGTHLALKKRCFSCLQDRSF